ncbi:MAG TPA: glycosyltransferase, partial [Allocoleopsis sp.]
GGGPQRQAFIDQIQQQGLHHCLFLPYQDKDVLPYSLTACDLALVSVSEGMEDLVAPSKLYSALSAGRPIAAICPPNSYLNTLITSAQCGAVFQNGASSDLAAFIRFLSKETQQAQQMGAAGRHYLETHFTPETIAQQYATMLQQAIAATQPTPAPIGSPGVKKSASLNSRLSSKSRNTR